MWWVTALVWLTVAPGRDCAALEGEMAELAKMVRDNCIGETGVDPALLAQVDGGADLMPDGTFKCYIKCTMEMAGAMADGAVDVEAILEVLPPELAASIGPTIRGCGTPRGADDCDTAYITQLCWQKTNKDGYFLI